MKYIKYIILVCLIIFKGVFINIISNINKYILSNNNVDSTKEKILEDKYNNLYNEYTKLTDLKIYNDKKHILTRLSYRKNYSSDEFYIYGGENKRISKDMLLINDEGLVGKVNKVYKDYSICTFLTGINNLNITINDYYGTIISYKDNLFIANDFTNKDNININDKVYTSTLGNIKTKEYIGYVYKIENKDINKKIYIKSDVNFNDISYLYVIGEV